MLTYIFIIYHHEIEKKKTKQNNCTLVLLCIAKKKKLLIKVAYLSKFCYHTSSCDPQSMVASFSPRAYQRPRCVGCRLLQLAHSNTEFEFYSDTEGISTFLLCWYCLVLVRPCSRSIPHPSSSIKWAHTRLRTRKLGQTGLQHHSARIAPTSRVHASIMLLACY